MLPDVAGATGPLSAADPSTPRTRCPSCSAPMAALVLERKPHGSADGRPVRYLPRPVVRRRREPAARPARRRASCLPRGGRARHRRSARARFGPRLSPLRQAARAHPRRAAHDPLRLLALRGRARSLHPLRAIPAREGLRPPASPRRDRSPAHADREHPLLRLRRPGGPRAQRRLPVLRLRASRRSIRKRSAGCWRATIATRTAPCRMSLPRSMRPWPPPPRGLRAQAPWTSCSRRGPASSARAAEPGERTSLPARLTGGRAGR